MGPRFLICFSVLLAATSTRANEVVDTSAQWYGALELHLGGDAYFSKFMAFGWPTDSDHQRLTSEFAAVPARRVISGLLSSGAGLPLSATREIRGESGKAGKKVAQLLGKYRGQAGLSTALPAAFDPTCIPALRSRQQLVRTFREDDLSTWRWVEAPQKYSLEGFGFALLTETTYARTQLLKEDPTPEDLFFAYLALHSALAKVSELRHLIYDTRRQVIKPMEGGELLDIDPHRFHFANSWTSEADSSGLLEHTLAEGDAHRRSYLRAQSALLLGLSNLLSLTDPKALKGTKKPSVLSANHHENLMELTLFAFMTLRAHHIDVREGKARSASKSGVAAPVDLGLCMLALEAFLDYVRTTEGRDPLKDRVESERRKARTLVSRLSQQLREWCDPGEGIFDSYDLASNRRILRTKSVASQAFAARGLLAAHRVLTPGSLEGPLLDAAHKALIWLDDERWVPTAGLYVDDKGGKEVDLLGLAATLGVLRELSLHYKDGHYLLRYRQLLEGAHEAGLFTPPGGKDPAGLAPTIVAP